MRIGQLARAANRAPVCNLAKVRLQAMRESLHRAVDGCSGKGGGQGCPVTEAVLAHGTRPGVKAHPDGAR